VRDDGGDWPIGFGGPAVLDLSGVDLDPVQRYRWLGKNVAPSKHEKSVSQRRDNHFLPLRGKRTQTPKAIVYPIGPAFAKRK